MEKLPNGVEEIVKSLAKWARGYNNHLKWNEVAKFKADLMNATDRWLVIDPSDFRAACLEEGMRVEDADELTGYLVRRKQGKRLVPQRSYRDSRFLAPVTVLPETRKTATSRDW